MPIKDYKATMETMALRSSPKAMKALQAAKAGKLAYRELDLDDEDFGLRAGHAAMTSSGDNPFRLEGEVALITGGGTGLGLAIARQMALAGANVVLAGRRAAVLKDAAAGLGPQAGAVVCDVTRVKAATGVVAKAGALFGPVTILVNNAGIHLKKSALETSDEELLSVLKTHVLGAHALIRAVLPGMLRCRHGSILFVASMASLFGIPNVMAYATAKSAYLGMVRSLATEVSPSGVRVNAVAPGWIDTDMSRKATGKDPARKRRILARTPLGKFGEPDDVGTAAVFLCSPAAKFVTGAVLPVDGGVSIGF
jgi:NAD(P)-dependent dehydrogenase (short-subunit alcohol dehydrogenase family)